MSEFTMGFLPKTGSRNTFTKLFAANELAAFSPYSRIKSLRQAGMGASLTFALSVVPNPTVHTGNGQAAIGRFRDGGGGITTIRVEHYSSLLGTPEQLFGAIKLAGATAESGLALAELVDYEVVDVIYF